MYFLEKVANFIIDNQENLGHYIIVFPNKRSVDYFNYFYAKISNTPYISKATTWHKFLYKSFPQKLINPSSFELLINLYLSVQKFLPEPAFSFDQFLPLGKIILSDFSEIDNYLLEPEKIFINLAQLEDLSAIEQILSEQQLKAIVNFWKEYSKIFNTNHLTKLLNNLPQIYHDFVSNILKKNFAYPGLTKKLICKTLKNTDIFSSYDTVLLVGFHALSKSEQCIFNHLKKFHNAKFFWDYDPFYMDPNHEASFFLNKNLQQFPNQIKIQQSQITSHDKNFITVSTPNNIDQTKILPKVFKLLNITKQEQFDKTAIVLLDETLLFPTLYSLPKSIEKINITLLFPLKLSGIYAFLNPLLKILIKFSIDKAIHYSLMKQLCNNKIFTSNFPEPASELSSLLQSIGSIYITLKQIQNTKAYDIFSIAKSQSPIILLEKLNSLLELIFSNSSDLDKEFIHSLEKELTALKNSLENYPQLKLSNKDILLIILQTINNLQVPFTPKRINSLQIIKILETRNLDFENIIFIGMNENIFPKISRPDSLLTEFIRKAYGLPIIKHQESINAYLFYRLLQHAKNAAFIYFSSSSDSKAMGKSRYLLQLQYETNLIKQNFIFNQKLITNLSTQTIKNNKNFKDQISFLSFSQIKTYANCPRLYFLKYLADINPPSAELQPELAPDQFGTVVHKTLELLFQHITQTKKSNIIQKNDLNIKNLNKQNLLNNLILKAFEQSQIPFNPNLKFNQISIHSIKLYVEKVLEFDKKFTPFEIISLEKEQQTKQAGYTYKHRISKDLSISLYGIFDRVDKYNNTIRIIDYKTGDKDLKAQNTSDIFSKPEKDAVFQGLFYLMIFKKIFPEHKHVIPLFYNIKKMNKDYNPYLQINHIQLDYNNLDFIDEILVEFEKNLNSILEQMLNDTTFEPSYNKNVCKNCPFKLICGNF